MLFCVGAEIYLTRLGAASLLRHPSEKLKLRVTVGGVFPNFHQGV